jgi:diacylglycerol kinase (ATP)
MHNPLAGTGEPSADELLSLLRAVGYEPVYQSTRAKHFADALQDPGDLVVVAGGDGTVRKVAARIAGRGIPMAILPVGTANNVATGFGITGSMQCLAAGWAAARSRRLRIGVVSGAAGEMEFVESAGVGFFADAMAMVDRDSEDRASPEGGELDRVRAHLRQELPRYPAKQWGAQLDGEPLPERLIALVTLNCGYVGPGLPLLPTADPGDELLRVAVIDPAHQPALSGLLEGESRALPPDVIRTGRVLTLCPPETVRVDGKFVSPLEEFGSTDRIEVRMSERWVDVLTG